MLTERRPPLSRCTSPLPVLVPCPRRRRCTGLPGGASAAPPDASSARPTPPRSAGGDRRRPANASPSTEKITWVVCTMRCIASSTRISPKRSLPSSSSAWRTSCTETLHLSAPDCSLTGAKRQARLLPTANGSISQCASRPVSSRTRRTPGRGWRMTGRPPPGSHRPAAAISRADPQSMKRVPLRSKTGQAGPVPHGQGQPGGQDGHRHQVKLAPDNDRGGSRAGFHLDRDPAIQAGHHPHSG